MSQVIYPKRREPPAWLDCARQAERAKAEEKGKAAGTRDTERRHGPAPPRRPPPGRDQAVFWGAAPPLRYGFSTSKFVRWRGPGAAPHPAGRAAARALPARHGRYRRAAPGGLGARRGLRGLSSFPAAGRGMSGSLPAPPDEKGEGCPRCVPAAPQAVRGRGWPQRAARLLPPPSPAPRPLLTLTSLLLPPCRPRVPLQV